MANANAVFGIIPGVNRDNTAAIQNAVDTMKQSGAFPDEPLVFDGGIYVIAGTVVLPDGACLMGSGQTSTDVVFRFADDNPTADHTVFSAAAGFNVQFKNLKFQGPATNSGNKTLLALSHAGTSGTVTWDAVFATGFASVSVGSGARFAQYIGEEYETTTAARTFTHVSDAIWIGGTLPHIMQANDNVSPIDPGVTAAVGTIYLSSDGSIYMKTGDGVTRWDYMQIGDHLPVYDAPDPPFVPGAGGVLTVNGEKSNIDIYWRSNWTQEGPGNMVIYGEARGLDTNDGLDPYRPVATYDAIMRKFPPGFRLGSRCNIHLADAASPNNGFDGGISCPPLVYLAKELYVGGAGDNYNSYTYSGPPKFRRVIELGALQSQSLDGTAPAAWTKLQFPTRGNTDDDVGMVAFLVAIAANGHLVLPQIPIVRNDDNGTTRNIIWIPDGGAMLNAFPADGTYCVGRPGVTIVTQEDYDIMITGNGCYRSGRLEKHVTDSDAQNPRPTFWGIEFAGVTVYADGVTFECCNMLDHPTIAMRNTIGFKNVRAQGGMYFHGGQGEVTGWRNNTTGNPTNRMQCYLNDGITTDIPDVYCDLHVAQKNAVSFSPGIYLGAGHTNNSSANEAGTNDGHHSGHLLIYKGISGHGLSTPMLYATDHSSFGMAFFSFFLANEVDTLVQAEDYAKVRLYGNGIRQTGTITNEFLVGSGSTGDPQVALTVANWKGAEGRNFCINRPRVPANWLGLGNAASPAYGCHARIYE